MELVTKDPTRPFKTNGEFDSQLAQLFQFAGDKSGGIADGDLGASGPQVRQSTLFEYRVHGKS